MLFVFIEYKVDKKKNKKKRNRIDKIIFIAPA